MEISCLGSTKPLYGRPNILGDALHDEVVMQGFRV